MKPANFPLRKLIRSAKANGVVLTEAQMEAVRAIRTKKNRGSLGTTYRL